MEKYYTPLIEEFHVGFEYEIFEDWDTQPEKTWWKQVYGENGYNPENMGFVDNFLIIENLVRVKYLDEQDIEELQLSKNVFITLENDYDVEVYIGSRDIEHRHFSGTIKNKSELKKLMQQLGI